MLCNETALASEAFAAARKQPTVFCNTDVSISCCGTNTAKKFSPIIKMFRTCYIIGKPGKNILCRNGIVLVCFCNEQPLFPMSHDNTPEITPKWISTMFNVDTHIPHTICKYQSSEKKYINLMCNEMLVAFNVDFLLSRVSSR